MKGLPEDTEIRHCWFCRSWHGNEKLCPTTAYRWTLYGLKLIGQKIEHGADFLAWWLAWITLVIIAIGLAQAIVLWLWDLARSALQANT